MDLLEQMAACVRIVESGSLAAAARQLRLSPATVSRRLSSLEARLGAPMILRTTRSFTVTEAGRHYYQRCLRVLGEIDEAQRSVRAHDAVEGLLTVSAPVTFGLALVCPHVPALLARHGKLRIDLRLEDRVVDLVSEAVDVAIRSGIDPPDSNSLVAQPLVTYGRVVVASPEYLKARGEPPDPESLSRHDLLVNAGGCGTRPVWHLLRDGRSVEIQARASFRSNAPYALREAALQGSGIALVPEWLVRQDLERGALRVLLSAWSTAPVRVFTIHRTELRGARKVQALVDHLRATLRSGASAFAGQAAPPLLGLTG
jgi:DNA-binding transcriptional LysR family regulator